MRKTTTVLSIAVALAVAPAPVSFGQEPARERYRTPPEQALARSERFAGTVEIGGEPGRRVQAVLTNWIVANDAALDRFPVSGLTVFEVRGGEVAVRVDDGEEREYREGEWWVVPAGSTLALETEDDSVVLQTLSLSEPDGP